MDYEDTANYTNSELYELRPSGSVVAKYEQTCAGDISEFNQLNHECQIDPHSNEIITLSYNIRSDYGTYESLEPLNTGMASKWRDAHGDDAAVNYCADALVAWDRTTGTTRQVGSLPLPLFTRGRGGTQRAWIARRDLWRVALCRLRPPFSQTITRFVVFVVGSLVGARWPLAVGDRLIDRSIRSTTSSTTSTRSTTRSSRRSMAGSRPTASARRARAARSSGCTRARPQSRPTARATT